MRRVSVLLLCLLLLAVQGAMAQDVKVNRTNKTISVTVTEKIRLDPDLAIVHIGFRNTAKTKDLAFEENVRVSNRITKALLDAGVPKEAIETESTQLQDTSVQKWEAQTSKEVQFQAVQQWKVRVAVPDAQKIVDIAMSAGANEFEDVNWIVADPAASEAKANASALDKARSTAQVMASHLGVKLGDLLYVSNAEPNQYGVAGGRFDYRTVEVQATPPPKLTLFPKKVETEATVTVVFAIE